MTRLGCLLLLAFACAATADEITVREALVIGPMSRGARTAFAIDPIELMRGTATWSAPREGDTITPRTGKELRWTRATADKDGWIESESLAGGYALATVDSDSERVMILDAAGHTTVLVNGVPHVGDPYEHGYVRLPVMLRNGTNELLFVVGRGRFRAKLVDPPSTEKPYIETTDVTAPDFVKGRRERLPFAALRVNPTTQSVDGIPPHSVRKKVSWIEYDGVAESLKDPASGIEFRIRTPEQTRKVTFISDIDGSVQYYAINPAMNLDLAAPRGLVLSLHGAGVEAIGQADAYSAKPWADIVCPTNRRPFGFDWEDWGRRDALEVLDHATKRLSPDPSIIYLTGHSMGGHGTWHLGALFPDRFAAIAPSAGWISFATYRASTQPTTQPDSTIASLMRRAASPSDTAALVRNYARLGIYVLHGSADDNVPASQARDMIKLIEPFHNDFSYHEQPKAGHWWDVSDEPGADCVDWPGIFDLFARRRIPGPHELREVEFVTPDPGVSSRCHWVTIEAQVRALVPSRASLRIDPHKRRVVGTTDNVSRLSIDLLQIKPDNRVQFDIDGQVFEIDWPARGRAWLSRVDGNWRAVDRPSRALKGPHRSGPLKDAFRNRMVFVYGTQGTPEENAWAVAKSRFDAEVWWYRGNGSVDIVADVDFDPVVDRDRNVVLYGNADTNARWMDVVDDGAPAVSRGRATLGRDEFAGTDLACMMVRPRRGSDVASVAVIAGTGVVGMRLMERLPIFVSGIGYPDYVLMSATAAQRGAEVIRAAGFFGEDWTVIRGEFVLDPPATKP